MALMTRNIFSLIIKKTSLRRK